MKEENCEASSVDRASFTHAQSPTAFCLRGRLSRIVGDNANHRFELHGDQRCRHSVVRVATSEFLIIYKIHNTFGASASASSLTCNKIFANYIVVSSSISWCWITVCFENSLSNLIDCFSSGFFPLGTTINRSRPPKPNRATVVNVVHFRCSSNGLNRLGDDVCVPTDTWLDDTNGFSPLHRQPARRWSQQSNAFAPSERAQHPSYSHLSILFAVFCDAFYVLFVLFFHVSRCLMPLNVCDASRMKTKTCAWLSYWCQRRLVNRRTSTRLSTHSRRAF